VLEGFMQNKILIVDDALLIRTLLRRILEENGYLVVGDAVNGIDAISKFEELRPDLIFMDITMPELDGIATIKRIKSMDSKVKIIIVSAVSQKKLVLDALGTGADDFIEKPFREEKIIEVLQKY
jgi:two-component system chemotaxis response regulator CheY